MKKQNKIYSPYLTIYKPQVGSIISILERISGLFLVICYLFVICFYYLTDSLTVIFGFYQVLYAFMKGNMWILEILLYFTIVNFVYHIYFLPNIYKRYNAVYGKINEYHIMPYKKCIIQLIFSILLVFLISFFLYILV